MGVVFVLSPMVFSSPVLWPFVLDADGAAFCGRVGRHVVFFGGEGGLWCCVLELWWVAGGVGSSSRVVDISIEDPSISAIGTMLCDMQFEVTVIRQSVLIRTAMPRRQGGRNMTTIGFMKRTISALGV